MTIVKKFWLLVLCTSLFACGGSPGSDTKTPTPDPSPAAVPVDIQSNLFAFAALYSDGRVKTWGDYYGSNTSSITHLLVDVVAIYSNQSAFAAVKGDGSVVTWGKDQWGGDSSRVQSELHNVVNIIPSRLGFAAVRSDKSVVSWGDPYYPDRIAPIIENVEMIMSSDTEYSAITESGTVTTWGRSYVGDKVLYDEKVALAPNVVHMQANNIGNFSVVLESGDILSWGRDRNVFYDNPAPSNIQGVKKLWNTGYGIIAQKEDGSITFWGAGHNENPYSIPPESLFDIVDLSVVPHNTYAAALSSDGTVHGWIASAFSGLPDEEEIQTYAEFPKTLTNIKTLYSNESPPNSDVTLAAIDGDQQVWFWNWRLDEPELMPVSGAVDLAVGDGGVVVLKSDKTVQILGDVLLEIDLDTQEPVVNPLLNNVVSVHSNADSFAVIREDGSIVTFGEHVDDGIVQ